MEYTVPVHTVVETPGYIREASAIFTTEEREEIVTTLAQDPERGDLMQGTGGVRKLRFGRGSKGKSGGGRVIYIFHDARNPIFLLAAFAKNEKPNLTKAERNALSVMVKALFRVGGRIDE